MTEQDIETINENLHRAQEVNSHVEIMVLATSTHFHISKYKSAIVEWCYPPAYRVIADFNNKRNLVELICVDGRAVNTNKAKFLVAPFDSPTLPSLVYDFIDENI